MVEGVIRDENRLDQPTAALGAMDQNRPVLCHMAPGADRSVRADMALAE